MRLLLTFIGVLGMGMVLTTAFAGSRPPAKAASANRVKSNGRLAQKIATNPALAARVRALVPSGMTLNDAAGGFATDLQLVTALRVARNLRIPFADLKAGAADRESLVQAVRALRPGEDEKAAVKIAERQARDDLNLKSPQLLQPDLSEN